MRRSSVRIAAKRARSATPDVATSSDSDASADSEPQDAQAAAVTMDEAGLVGPGVQVPSPAVWQLLTHAVRVDGARHVSELISAMGGPLRGASDDCTLSEMSLECYLSMLMPPPREVVVGDAVRVLCGDNPLPAWRSGTITMVGAGIVMAKVDGVSAPMRFDRVDWRYLAAPSPPAAAPPRAPRQRTAREPLSLTSPGPDDYGRKRAAELRRMSCRAEAVAAITKHIAYGAGAGNRLARRAVLAIHARQTLDEQRDECTKYRNAAGWSKIDAQRCVGEGEPFPDPLPRALRVEQRYRVRMRFIFARSAIGRGLGRAYPPRECVVRFSIKSASRKMNLIRTLYTLRRVREMVYPPIAKHPFLGRAPFFP